ncbi:unnamed protein product [Acanthoscelides obtectus]|uniref:RNA-directed DNA polymerase n=1 Tax=Acanthoscelides obtectus TaxID=200917 RepID=A0A9P0MAQ0_ACAOB|nr:unnamed protein product [Acanthoscelides obtectus]CAK1648739.1 Transposon Ty3-G Gag-Pol polyprotein [Acanthoscelides obtectus]
MPKQKQRKSRKRSRREPSSSSTTSSSSGSSSNSNGHKHKRSRCKSRETVSSEHYSTFTRADQGIHISMVIPEFDPKINDISEWLEVIKYNADIYKWPDSLIKCHALNKLKGTAKTWYDSFIQGDLGWSSYAWGQWEDILKNTFQSTRNAYQLLMEMVNHRPSEGAINDVNITSAVEAANIRNPHILAAYLKNKTYTGRGKPLKSEVQQSINQSGRLGASDNIVRSSTIHQNVNCTTGGNRGHERNDCKHRNKICNFCRIKGHIEVNCFKKRKNSSEPGRWDNSTKSSKLELLAIVKTLERFRFYLVGYQFQIFTDCNAVKNALSKQSIIPRIARWVLSLQEFSFTIHHKAGTQMQHVDALSRNFNESQNKAQVLLIQEDDYLREAQDQDESIVEIKNILLSGDVQSHKDVFNNYDLRGNKVYKLTPYGRRWVVPKKCRWQIVKANHDDIGHFAVDKTLEKIKQRYWFPRMRHFITKYINACLPCLYYKDKGDKRPGYLHSIPKYARPHHTLHIDHLGPFVNTKQGNKYLIVVVDGFSKFVYLKAVPDTSAKYVIQMLTEMFAMLGNPRRLITDLGSAFTSKAFEEFVAARGIRLFTTAVGLPRGNGQCERTNRTVLDALATSGSQTSEDNWDTNLSHIQQGLNSTRHRITQNTPAEVMFGFQLRTDSDKYPDDDMETTLDVTKIRKETAKRLEHNRIEQDLKFNTKRSLPRLYQVGDVVLTKVTSFSANEDSKKLRPKFRGPFKIVEVLPNDRYRVQEDRFTQRSRRPYQAVVSNELLKCYALNGICSALNGKCYALNGICSALNGICSALNGKCYALNGICSALNGKCYALNGICSALNGKCYALNGICSALNGKCYALNGICSALNGKCYALNGICSALNGKCYALNGIVLLSMANVTPSMASVQLSMATVTPSMASFALDDEWSSSIANGVDGNRYRCFLNNLIFSDVRDERDVRMAVQSHSMSVAADRQIDGGWGKMTRREDAKTPRRMGKVLKQPIPPVQVSTIQWPLAVQISALKLFLRRISLVIKTKVSLFCCSIDPGPCVMVAGALVSLFYAEENTNSNLAK